MALIKCPDCAVEVSDQATNCLKCGRPIKQSIQKAKFGNFVKNSLLPVINQCAVLLVSIILGIVAKMLTLSITVTDLFNKYSTTDVAMNALAESGIYILFAFAYLTALIKNDWVSNKDIYIVVVSVLAMSVCATFAYQEYAKMLPIFICLSLALIGYQRQNEA